MMASLQVPLTSTFPSGQVHLAPVGLSRHMKSQDILRHGFEAVERVEKNRGKKKKLSQEDNLSAWPEMRQRHLFVKQKKKKKKKCLFFSQIEAISSVFNLCL